MQVCYNPCIAKKTCIENARRKRNAAGGAENIWFYCVQLSKSYMLLLLVATSTTWQWKSNTHFYEVSNDYFL